MRAAIVFLLQTAAARLSYNACDLTADYFKNLGKQRQQYLW